MTDLDGTNASEIAPDGPVKRMVDKQVWCSTDVEEFRGFEYYRDGICHSFMDLIPEPDSLEGWDFFGSVETRPIGVGRLNKVVATSHRVLRTKAEIARSPEECFYLNFKLRGECHILQSGEVATLAPGDVGIFDSAKPFELEHRGSEDLSVSSFMIPRQAIKDRLSTDLPQAPLILSSHPTLGALLRETAATLTKEIDTLTASEAERMYDMLVDLTAMALSPNGRLQSTCGDASRANAVLQSAKAYLDENHLRRDISANTVANTLGISVRYLHKLFAQDNVGFSEYLINRRLDTAASTLKSSIFSQLSIAAVSNRSAFSDPAHFHRAFKARYGCTPGDWRADQTTSQSPKLNRKTS